MKTASPRGRRVKNGTHRASPQPHRLVEAPSALPLTQPIAQGPAAAPTHPLWLSRSGASPLASPPPSPRAWAHSPAVRDSGCTGLGSDPISRQLPVSLCCCWAAPQPCAPCSGAPQAPPCCRQRRRAHPPSLLLPLLPLCCRPGLRGPRSWRERGRPAAALPVGRRRRLQGAPLQRRSVLGAHGGFVWVLGQRRLTTRLPPPLRLPPCRRS